MERRPDLPLPAALAGLQGIEFISCPAFRGDAWGPRIGELRAQRDCLRYLEAPFARASKLRARAIGKLVKAMSGGARSHLHATCPRCADVLADEDVVRMLAHGDTPGRLDSLLALVEETIPSDRTIDAFLRAERPDVLVVTPLVKIGSLQADYVKSARAVGVPVVFPVFSWDNLSTKGLIHVLPDRVLVWNDWQRKEAVEMHRVPAERVVVTGAPRFDEFFAMKPRVTRERFCRKLRLDAGKPIVTYVCSSSVVAGHERDFVLRWIHEVRRMPELESCNIVIRPHPREKGQWKTVRIPAERVAVMFPRSISVDQTLYDAVHHSVAVVGLNTSAQLEAGIVGRPVLTILAPEFADGQQGTVHFRYLLKEHGGFVEVAPDFETHRRHLATAVTGAYDPEAIRSSIERFVRPHGLDRRVSPIMVDAIESLAGGHRKGIPEPAAARAWRSMRIRLSGFRRRAYVQS